MYSFGGNFLVPGGTRVCFQKHKSERKAKKYSLPIDPEGDRTGTLTLPEYIYATYNELMKNGWRMKEIDEMDMLGFQPTYHTIPFKENPTDVIRWA